MLGQMDMMSAAQSGLNRISSDAAARQLVSRKFDKLRGLARRRGRFNRAARAMPRLADLPHSPADGAYGGVQTVPLDAIVGTENRADEFDCDFLPNADHVEARWVSVAAAFQRGVCLPPLVLLQVGGRYYVRDGHHRVSVYRAYGQATVEAEVIRLH